MGVTVDEGASRRTERHFTTRPRLTGQVALGLALFGYYLLVDATADAGRRAAARRHGRGIYDLERHLHLDVERGLNTWLAPHHLLSTLANYEYACTYILSALALLAWVWRRRPDLWGYARDSFVALNLIAITTFLLYPTAPPRMLHDLGFVDTVSRGGTVGSWGWGPVDTANQIAAMPSLHIGWALWVSVVLARFTFRRSVQVLSAAHVLLTLFVIMSTANHYLLDAVAVVVPVLVAERFAHWRYAGPPGEVVASHDAFFLHVEATGAPQHVGGLVLLGGSGDEPSIEEVRERVRTHLLAVRRYRQRLGTASRWQRPRWVEDPDVDLDQHVQERRVDGPLGLYRLIADLAERPMPRDRPLWLVLMVRGIAAEGEPPTSALVFLAHHAIADGIGTVISALRMFDPSVSLPAPARAGPGRLARATAVAVGLAQLAGDGGARPVGRGSARREFGVVDVPLEAVRRAATTRHARVTDLVIAAVVDAVREAAPGLVAHAGGSVKVSVPLMVRAPDAGAQGNATAAIIVDVPTMAAGEALTFDALLAEVSRRTTRLRRPTRAIASRFVMAAGLRILPEPAAAWFARTVYGARFLHLVVSNMPGPTQQLSLLGSPLHRIYPILPVAPGTPLALGALSWTGVLGVGLATDPALLDAAALAGHLDHRLAALTEPAGSTEVVEVSPRPLEGEEQPSP